MKIPAPPPATSADDLDLEAVMRAVHVLDRVGAEQDGRYLHWDELRHRSPPHREVSREDWWHAVRWARLQIARDLPLADPRGKPFTFSMTDTIQRLVHEVDRDASGRVAFPEDVTHPATRDRYVISSLSEEAITSSQLEGAVLAWKSSIGPTNGSIACSGTTSIRAIWSRSSWK